MGRTQAASARFPTSWLVAAAIVFGTSVWALHFVAILAFMPGRSMAYDVDLTIASVLVAVGGALLALLAWRSPLPTWLRVALSGSLFGLAVSGMHYVGVAAMSFSGLMFYDRDDVAASLVVSAILSTVAVARASHLASFARRMEVTGWFSLAICGLHFTGMSALTLTPGVAEVSQTSVLGTLTLAVIVGAVSVALLLASLSAVLVEQYLSQRAMQELRRMRLLGNLAHEVLVIHRDGIVVEVNNACERLFDRSADELVGRDLMTLFSAESVPALVRRAACGVSERRPEEMAVRTRDGTHVAVELSCQLIDYLGKPATAMALRDLSDRKRDEERIRHMARHDALTQLPNRYNLQERLDQAIEIATRTGSSLAVMYIDLDRFKPINDVYGHAAGDALLVQASKRILAEIQPSDLLARVGGDEFVMLLGTEAGADRDANVATVAERVLAALGRPFAIDDRKFEIGASIGISMFPGDGADADTLLRAADTAMYRVKDEGRNSVRFFEVSMDDQLQVRRQLEQELTRAIDRNELFLHYQPIVNGVSGEVETFEALIRWKHAERGLIPPLHFIPLAERTGQITAIGKWVIDTACQEAAGWPSPWRVAVNVSPVQFRQSDLCDTVVAALARTGLQANRLVVEITEGVLIDNSARAVEVLQSMRDVGIRLALDDFGTGYSSLSYLQKFKFDKFKVDKSFVKRIGESDEALTITKTIVNLGHNLGLQVTAEGVETPQQLALLQQLGCDQIQGYLVSRPLPVEFFTEFDRARTRAMFQASVKAAVGQTGTDAERTKRFAAH